MGKSKKRFSLRIKNSYSLCIVNITYDGVGMNRLEHLLTIFQEELLEVGQEVSKAKRFGIDEQRDLPTSNRERIVKEWNDVLGMVEMLSDEGIDLPSDVGLIEEKKKKVEKYLRYSKELGTLTNHE